MLLVAILFTYVFLVAGKAAMNNENCDLSHPKDSYMRLNEDYAEWRRAVTPEASSAQGNHEFDAELNKRSMEDYQNIKLQCEAFGQRAKKLHQTDDFKNEVEKHYLEVIQEEAKYCSEGIDKKGYLMAEIDYRTGIQVQIPRWFQKPSFFQLDSIDDYDAVLSRLKQIPKRIDDIIDLAKEGIKQKITLAKSSLVRTEKQFDLIFDKGTKDSAFYFPFKSIHEKSKKKFLCEAIQNEAINIIENDVIPSYKKLKQFIDNEYMPNVRPADGVHSLPNGKEYYNDCLKWSTTDPTLTAEEIHKIGLQAVMELRRNVSEAAHQLGKGELDFIDFVKYIQEMPEQRFKSKDELLDYIINIINNKINPTMNKVIPEEFLSDKLYKVNVKPTPPGSGGLAFYIGASKDGKRNGTYYINLDNLQNFKKFELMGLTLHEANPGHHFDISIFRQQYDFPEFMTSPRFGTLTTIPSKIPYYIASSEGWGLYSEYLGNELGLYTDIYDLLGHYSWALLRAARLVVDTGVHHYGWTRAEVIDYLRENTMLSDAALESNADRYILWPGQAVTYLIGQRNILDLRQKEKQRLGEKFNLQQFHKYLLSCFGPLEKVHDCIQMRERIDNA